MPDNGWEDCKFVFDFIRTSLWKQSWISTGAERFEDKRTVSNDPSKTQTIYLLHQLHVDCSLYYPLYHISLQGKTTKTWPITLWPYKETQFSLIHYSQVCCAFIACVHEVHIHVKSTHYKTVFASEYALSISLSLCLSVSPLPSRHTQLLWHISSPVTICADGWQYVLQSWHILLPATKCAMNIDIYCCRWQYMPSNKICHNSTSGSHYMYALYTLLLLYMFW